MRGKLGFSVLFAGVLVSRIAWGTAFYNQASFCKQSSSGSGGKSIQFAIEFPRRPASSNTCVVRPLNRSRIDLNLRLRWHAHLWV